MFGSDQKILEHLTDMLSMCVLLIIRAHNVYSWFEPWNFPVNTARIKDDKITLRPEGRL